MTPEPTEMDERVADALFDAMPGKLELHDAIKLARAAIRVMREPTPDMEVKLRGMVKTSGAIGKDWYHAGIDAASPQEE